MFIKYTWSKWPSFSWSELDRVIRQMSYLKDFEPINMEIIKLKKGSGLLTLKSLDIIGNQVMVSGYLY